MSTATVVQQTRVAALLDLENLLHAARHVSGHAIRAEFLALVEQIRRIGDVRHAVACCDWWLAGILTPVAAPSGVRIFAGRSGKDRADGELLRRAADVPRSTQALVLGSGDGIFAPLVAAQALAGRLTTVVGVAGSIATSLRAAAHEVVELRPRTIHLDRAA